MKVTPSKSLCLHNAGRRFKVSWTIDSSDQSAHRIASFPERLEFISESDAFQYAENRAHTFIDSMLIASAPIVSRDEIRPVPNSGSRRDV
jgi:hypothetical protein